MSAIPADKVAAAVSGYVKALRTLGRMEASVHQIAQGLRLTMEEVEEAFDNYRIPGGALAKDNRRVAAAGPWSRAIDLKPCARSLVLRKVGK